MTNAFPHRLCAHFGECGGCQHQDWPYEAQLAAKAERLKSSLRPFWREPICVEPSPVIWNYRNKVDFSFGPCQYPEKPPAGFVRETVLGFNRPGKWYWPFDVGDCLIGPEGSAKLLAAVREWYRAHGLRAYDSRTHEGLLRVLLVRDAKRTGERMVALITSPGAIPAESFVAAVRGAYPTASVFHGTFSRRARVAQADELRLLSGAEVMEEQMLIPTAGGVRTLRFRISPFSFFQVNTLAAERLYAQIREWVARVAPPVLYDLYGGSGGVALACADLAPVVRSVESVEDATRDGIANAAINEVTNVFFATEDVKTYLRNLDASGGFEPGSAAVVDPPRSGIVPKALHRLANAGPEHLLYVSCKPEQTAAELPVLVDRYRLESVSAIDMFPHTHHVEALLAFRRK